MAIASLELHGGVVSFGDSQVRPWVECAPDEVEKVVLVADYDSRVTTGERILDRGVSRVSIGTFLGLMVAGDRGEAFRDAVVVFEHEVMKDAHLLGGRSCSFSIEDPVVSSGLADLVRRLIPRASVVVCNNEHPVSEVIAHYPRVAPIADLVKLGLA